MSTSSYGEPDLGWALYSGIMLIIAGAVGILNAIWALRYDSTVVDLVFFENDLEIWAIIWIAVGIILILAGVAVFRREQWARWLGIVAASIAILSNISWAQIQPIQSLIGAILAGLVIYGLAAHGGKEY